MAARLRSRLSGAGDVVDRNAKKAIRGRHGKTVKRPERLKFDGSNA
jgi:hypothetical protein